LLRVFHIDNSIKLSKKAVFCFLFMVQKRCREAARIIDGEALRIAAGRQGWKRKGYVLLLAILLNSATKLPPLFVLPDPLLQQRQTGFVAEAQDNPAHELVQVRGTPSSCRPVQADTLNVQEHVLGMAATMAALGDAERAV
jgi:hypothetical protein